MTSPTTAGAGEENALGEPERLQAFNEWLSNQIEASDLVQQERVKQHAKWGDQSHTLSVYLTILMEEMGELAEEILNQELGYKPGRDAELLNEAIQTAAVAQAIVQRISNGRA